jgi:hypothetical protein
MTLLEQSQPLCAPDARPAFGDTGPSQYENGNVSLFSTIYLAPGVPDIANDPGGSIEDDGLDQSSKRQTTSLTRRDSRSKQATAPAGARHPR